MYEAVFGPMVVGVPRVGFVSEPVAAVHVLDVIGGLVLLLLFTVRVVRQHLATVGIVRRVSVGGVGLVVVSNMCRWCAAGGRRGCGALDK